MAPLDSEVEHEIFDKISNNDIAGVKTILSQDKIKADIHDKHGMTPLQHAAYKGNKELVQLLLDQGADVNSGKHEYNYTALHFAALSGNSEICQLLLEHGAKINATNSVGRTPSQMAAFVGNHDCVAIINNFVPKSDIDYYTKPRGLETESKLPGHLALPLHKFIMQVNLNPVKIAMNLQKLQSLCDNLDKVKNILELMSEREMKRGMETNEIMSFKFHYLSCIVSEIIKCKKSLSSQGDKSDPIEFFIKKLLKTNKADVPEFQESFLRECVREFPHRECTIFRQMVTSLSRSDSPSALSVIMSAVNGQRGFADSETLTCNTCGEEKATKKCAKCKSVQYCDRECQKLHWFLHKKVCSKLSEQLEKNSDVNKGGNEKEKQHAISAATEMLASELSTLKSS